MDTLTDIGAELVELRRSRGWTQGALASRLGVKRQQVQRWEASAYRSASLERTSRVAVVLGWRPPVSEARPQVAAETAAAYSTASSAARSASPARDLGEVVARVRAHAPGLRERFGVKSVAVFGSFARGEQTPTSDVDMLVEVEVPSLENVFGAERALEAVLGRKAETGSLGALDPRVRRAIEAELVHVWPA